MVGSIHKYPARSFPVSDGGMASSRIHDLIVKGVAELGHEVFYWLPNGAAEPLPEGVTLVSDPVWDVDLIHAQQFELTERVDFHGLPWVRTCHVDIKEMRGLDRSVAGDNFIFVSETLAKLYGRNRFVRNGIDPSEFIFSESKGDYLLFMCCLDRAVRKGLDAALSLSDATGMELVVAGSASDGRVLAGIEDMCRLKNVRLVGEVKGEARAELLAGAKALVFPTMLNEAFGLVMAEALMSGTPVICSDKGACVEIISQDVGFVCSSHEDYLNAINRLHEIDPQRCRDKAMREYHYLKMAAGYVREYEKEIQGGIR